MKIIQKSKNLEFVQLKWFEIDETPKCKFYKLIKIVLILHILFSFFWRKL